MTPLTPWPLYRVSVLYCPLPPPPTCGMFTSASKALTRFARSPRVVPVDILAVKRLQALTLAVLVYLAIPGCGSAGWRISWSLQYETAPTSSDAAAQPKG